MKYTEEDIVKILTRNGKDIKDYLVVTKYDQIDDILFMKMSYFLS